MTYQNDKEAFRLAVTYGFCPPQAVYPARIRNTNTGKYEPDHAPAAELRCMVLAHFSGKTNIIIQYNPLMSETYPYNVAGTLTPHAAGNYTCESGYNDRPTYLGPQPMFAVWWDGVDSWLISEQVGHLDGPYWKRTNPAMAGDYAPFNGAVGTATVIVGPE